MSTSLKENLKILSLFLLANNIYPFYIKTITKYQKQINCLLIPYFFYRNFLFETTLIFKNPLRQFNYYIKKILRSCLNLIFIFYKSIDSSDKPLNFYLTSILKLNKWFPYF